ncbi:MAG TPA: ABC transporter substrate-binding protein [Methanospirillum sp.]|uniref:ABC transporter substrate-binding protein n=1 Tax=Methanospirillum sp. TaxID=45200 RepID=UPI002CDC9C9C|nr:ABC transporter substrate-binding protein [Methanospirillum sp.]HWQ64744.1 ABC transporter substrate-binding protein [Methanospirillum sp.]
MRQVKNVTKTTSWVVLAFSLALLMVALPVVAEDSKAKDVVNIGYQPSTHHLAFTTAYQKGYYNETLSPLGVKEVKAYSFPTGAPEIQALLAGDIDFAYVGSAPFVTGVANGLNAKIIAAVNTQGSDLVLKKDLPYKAPADLKGLKIATFPAGTIQDTILRDWLKKNGLDADKDVEIVPLGPGDAITAFLAGKVDAAFLPQPSPVTIEDSGTGKIIVHSGEMEQDHACCVLVATDDVIKNHPELVEQVLKTHLKATEFNAANKEEAAKHLSELTGLNTSIILKSFDEWDGQFVSDPAKITTSVENFAKIQKDLGYIKKDVSDKDLFDTSFWGKVKA